MKRLRISLMFKIMLLCVGLVLVSSLAIRYFAYQTAKNTIESTMGQMSLEITRSVSETIDGDKYQELKTAADMETDYYKEMRDKLIDIRQETGLKYLYTMNRADDGTFYYVLDGSDYGSEDESLLGDVDTEITPAMHDCMDGIEKYEFGYSDEWGYLISGYTAIKNSKGEIVGLLGADFDANYMVDRLKKANTKMYLMMGLIMAICIFASVFFAYMIVRLIKKLNSKVKEVQSGDLTVNVDINRTDEVGSLSASFKKMIENMSSMIHSIRNHTEDAIRDVDSLNSNVDISNKATEEITKIVSEIASGAAKQVENVDQVEDSMEHVFSEIETITKNIDSVNQASDLSIKDMQEASDKINNSVQQINLVNDTVETTASMMKKLEEKFQEVLSFSDSVSAIATKTNLLALNASIEAASAGEHGKGFAVVAGEIKNLAKQSSEASKKINELISAVQEEIRNSSDAIGNGVVQARNGVNVMSQVELQLDKLSNSNQKINTRIKEIAQAINSIEQDSKNVLERTSLLAEIARELSAGTQQTSAETEEQYAIMEGIRNDLVTVKNRMEELGSTVNQFKIK